MGERGVGSELIEFLYFYSEIKGKPIRILPRRLYPVAKK